MTHANLGAIQAYVIAVSSRSCLAILALIVSPFRRDRNSITAHLSAVGATYL